MKTPKNCISLLPGTMDLEDMIFIHQRTMVNSRNLKTSVYHLTVQRMICTISKLPIHPIYRVTELVCCIVKIQLAAVMCFQPFLQSSLNHRRQKKR